MLKRALVVIVLTCAAASAVAGRLDTITCLLGRTSEVTQEVAGSKAVQAARHLELQAAPRDADSDEDDEDDEFGRYYDERDVPFKPLRW